MGTPRKGTKPHPAKTIARAMAILATGGTVADVVAELKIPKQTVSDWAKLVPETGQPRTKKEVVEELYAQYLEETLHAVLAQLKVCADPEWIKKQSAAELATLHGVLFDKSVRVFDAARRGAELREQHLATAGNDEEH